MAKESRAALLELKHQISQITWGYFIWKMAWDAPETHGIHLRNHQRTSQNGRDPQGSTIPAPGPAQNSPKEPTLTLRMGMIFIFLNLKCLPHKASRTREELPTLNSLDIYFFLSIQVLERAAL